MAEPDSTVGRTIGSRARLWGPALLFAAVLVWVFQDVMLRGRLLSYRDTLQFYYPLFDYLQREWEAGRIPLWNPYTNGGEPILALGTSSVLYPLKLLFFLPLSYWARFHLYVLVHVAIAAGTCGWTARQWGASRPAATLAALSYAFSGNVLFNYSNVVFLVGAAWLPLVLWSGESLLRERTWSRVPLTAGLLALIVFGGDPQLGYVAGLTLTGFAWLQWRSERREAAPVLRRPTSWLHRRPVLLAAIAGLGGLYAAAQILPTLDWSRESLRAARHVPLSLYDLPGWWLRDAATKDTPGATAPRWYEGFLGTRPAASEHEISLYDFSFAPWRCIEYLWPNIDGGKFPLETMWPEALGWIDPPWVPSQYMGLLPLLLALSAMRLRGGETRQRWLTWMAVLCGLASFGSYAPGRWILIPELTSSQESDELNLLSSAFGGLYWLMVTVLPGWAAFRFPSKMLVPAACALSLLAARGLDALLSREGRRGGWGLVLLSLVSALGGSIVWLQGDRLAGALQQSGIHLQALAADSAMAGIATAFWHSLIVSVFAWLLLRTVGKGSASGKLAWSLVLLTALDLAAANRSLIGTVDRARWETPPSLVAQLGQAATERLPNAVRPPRLHRPPNWYFPILEDYSGFEEEANQAWQRATLFGQQHLPFHIPVVQGHSTIESNSHRLWFVPRPTPAIPPEYLQPRHAFDDWGTNFFLLSEQAVNRNRFVSGLGLYNSWGEHPTGIDLIIPSGPPLPQAVTNEAASSEDLPFATLLFNESAFPPAWIVHRIRPMAPIESQDTASQKSMIDQMVIPLRPPLDLRREALVEDAELARQPGGGTLALGDADDSRESCRVTSYAPNHVEIEATLTAEGVVVLSDAWTADWKASVSTDDAALLPQPVWRVNRTMRGVRLPAGRHVIQFDYHPLWFYAGAGVSAAALSISAGLCLWTRLCRGGRTSAAVGSPAVAIQGVPE